MLAEDRLLLPY